MTETRRLRPVVMALVLVGTIAGFLFGTMLVGEQTYLYLEDGARYSATILQIVTYDLDPRLADAIGFPSLASWHETHSVFDRERDEANLSVQRVAEGAREIESPELGPWRSWLKYPESWFGLNKLVVGLLGALELGLLSLAAAGGLALTGIWSWHVSRSGDGEEPATYD